MEKEILKPDIIEENEALASIPEMKLEIKKEEKECIVSDETLLSLYHNILGKVKTDRKNANSIQRKFLDMVMNEGESSSASKEAIVNLEKIKADGADKMIKIAELMTRIKLKDANTFPHYLAAQQNNKITIEKTISKRDFLKKLEGENE